MDQNGFLMKPLREELTSFLWQKFVHLFALFFIASFVFGISGYSLLHHVVGQHKVFGELFRMFPYHEQHPTPYIAIVAFFYAVLAGAWSARSQAVGRRRHLQLLGVLIATLILSSAVGGILWTFHEMQAGYFPPWERRIEAFGNGIVSGFCFGWVIVLLSFPFNVLSLLFAYALALYLPQRIPNA